MDRPTIQCPVHGEVSAWGRGCHRCEHDERRRRQRVRDAVRKPPRPAYEGQPGRCALCGDPPQGRRRTWCGDWCVQLWWIATASARALDHLVELHGHACWECGTVWQPGQRMPWDLLQPDGGWEGARYCTRPTYGPPAPRPVDLYVDHVRPLWSLTDDERGELRWWLPFNLQLLCARCHGAKTADEARQRAALRRGEQPVPRQPAAEQLVLG